MKISFVLFCFCLFLKAYSAEALSWSSTSGHSFEGSFVSKEANTVTLKGRDGKNITIPLKVLDEKSLKQLEKAYAEAMKNAPVFTYQNSNYRYALYPRRDWLHLEFLRAGKPLRSEPYVFVLQLAETIDRKFVMYKITGMDGEPIETRDEVELRLTTDIGITLRLFVSKTNSKDFNFHFATEQTEESHKRFTFSSTIRFDPMLKYDMESKSYIGAFSETGITFDQFPDMLNDYTIEYRKGKVSTKISYAEKQQGTKGGDKVSVTHPGDPVFTAERRGDKGNMLTSFYGGKTPIEGFSIRFYATRADLLEAGPFTIEVKPL